MRITAMIILLLAMASCGGGRYHKTVIDSCKMRNISDQQCSDEYYKARHDENDFRYNRSDRY